VYVPPMMGDSSQGYLPIKADNAPYLSVIVKTRHNVEATSGRLSVIFLSRVMRHVSIATWVYILACDGKGARAPGGHGTSNSPGDHYHGSS
jgi:hypothetical protein